MPNRRDSRSLFSILVRIHRLSRDEEPGFYGTTHDISESGLLLRLGRKLEIGEQISVSFFIVRTRKLLELKAKVKRIVLEHTDSESQIGHARAPESFSYGVQFIGLNQMEQALLRAHVARFA